MKFLMTVLFVFNSAIARADAPKGLTDLSSLQWVNRIVIINELVDTEVGTHFFDSAIVEIDDRNIIWFVFYGDRTTTNYSSKLSTNLRNSIREAYDVELGQVVLIGKDGGVKARYHQLQLDDIFSDIDAMPMRQYEMQNP